MKKEACFFIVFLITLFCFNSNAQVVNNSDTHGKKVIPSIIPPQISSPANNSAIVITNPLFVWIPPRPSNETMVTYCIRLVKVQNGQTDAEALLQNPALLNICGLTNTFLSYPMDAPALQAGGKYAWQVAASSGGQNLGAADVSSFSVKKDSSKKDPDMNYPVASKVSKERFYISHGIFHFVYNNITNEKTLSYTLKSMDKSMQNISGLPVVKLTPGMNKLQIDLQQSGKLKNGTYYYLEIKDKRQQVYKLMYYYVES